MASDLDGVEEAIRHQYGIGIYSDKVLEGSIQSDNYTFKDWERDNPHNGTHIVSHYMIISNSSSLMHNFTCTLISDNVYDGYVIPFKDDKEEDDD